jgi:DNA replication protein DnaC
VLLGRHRADDTVSKAIARVLRADLVVVDDIGPLPVAQDAAEGLYRSVAVSSNLHAAAFDELMPKTLATATVDRLLHHAHVCQTSGDSVRLSQALPGQGVRPLA